MRRRIKWTALLLCACLLLGGCGAAAPAQAAAMPSEATTPEPVSVPVPAVREEPTPLLTGQFIGSSFHESLAETEGDVKLDLSAIREGYVAVSVKSDTKLKFQVRKDDWVYNYNIASDGTPSIFPLQCGDGDYAFRVLENVGESKYAEIFNRVAAVELEDEFQPFLRPSDYSRYDSGSACVKLAAELAAGKNSRPEIVAAVYDYVCASIRYDNEKAAAVKSGYMPDPDETLKSGKGICFDYASLAAAMLRSQGIPTKLIFGYVAPDDLYHAWNMFYTEESGWVTVSFEVGEDSWNRLDLTFSAGGADSAFVGDGSHYTDLYCY